MKKIMTLAALVLALSTSAFAGTLYCNADGVVSEGTTTYNYSDGTFTSAQWFWTGNWYAQVMKTQIGSVVDANGKVLEASVKFDLVLQSDGNGCAQNLKWVKDSDFVRLPSSH